VFTFRATRTAISAAAVAALSLALAAVPTRADLASRYQDHQQRADQLRSTIQSESSRIDQYDGTLAQLQSRLSTIQHSVDVQEGLLAQTRAQAQAARHRLTLLEADYARDQKLLADQLVNRYESPPPTIVGVIIDARGFDDLLNGVKNLQAIEHQNARALTAVKAARHMVTAQTQRLAKIQARRQRATTTVLIERDQVAQIRLSIANKRLNVARQKAQATSRLQSLRKTLAKEAAKLDAQAAAAAASTGGAPVAPGSCPSGRFAPHGGAYGFFPAAGTNYSTGEEPVLAARLDALGRALQLHLIGISGYRTPAHSVAVGGFADDPHTQGIASDTPGVEGVSEGTLNQFCLTRPFGGAREADHIQPI
jgi:peptidoglycan hydrolase CwlO-like protein